MFKIYQITNGRWQITIGYNEWSNLPHSLVAAILWRSFPTQAEAEAFAASYL